MLADSEEPFLCQNCLLQKQGEKIAILQEAVKSLTRKVNELQQTVTSPVKSYTSALSAPSNSGSLPLSLPASAFPAPPNSGSLPLTLPVPSVHPHIEPASSVTPQSSSSPVQQPHPLPAAVTSDRKFNVVVFGVPELPKGSSRYTRSHKDYNNVCSLISKLEKGSDHKSLVRDCHRVGRYDMNKCRPILVLLNSTADVRNILSKCHSLSSPVSIKPDRSTTERKIEAILLKERWKLIQLGMDRRSIRLRNSAIYVNGRLHGRVTGSVFMPTPTLGDIAPHLSTLSVSTSTPTVHPASPPNYEVSTASSSTSIPSTNPPSIPAPSPNLKAASSVTSDSQDLKAVTDSQDSEAASSITSD